MPRYGSGVRVALTMGTVLPGVSHRARCPMVSGLYMSGTCAWVGEAVKIKSTLGYSGMWSSGNIFTYPDTHTHIFSLSLSPPYTHHFLQGRLECR
jgi:hypothetical protein